MTPKVKKEVAETPPSGPAMLQKHLRDDIEVALLARSVPLLSMALLRGHCCGEDHSLHEAVRMQNLKALHFLLQITPAAQVDLHCRGRRPLHHAIVHCMSKDDIGYKMLEALLSSGASANFCDGDDPSQGAPLHQATERGCGAAMELLLAHGADPNARDENDCTPLHKSCQRLFKIGFVEEKVVNLLLAKGACPVATDSLGREPADYAHDRGLLHKLQKASQRWARQQMNLTAGQSASEETRVPWQLPEIFDFVIEWL
jgi:hypothetical protein